MEKKLYRSRTNKILAGVCGGIGEHLNVNAWIFRILFILFGIGFLGIALYVVLAIILPVRPAASNDSEQSENNYTATPMSNTTPSTQENWGDEWETAKPSPEKKDDDKPNNTFTLG